MVSILSSDAILYGRLLPPAPIEMAAPIKAQPLSEDELSLLTLLGEQLTLHPLRASQLLHGAAGRTDAVIQDTLAVFHALQDRRLAERRLISKRMCWRLTTTGHQALA